MTKLERIKSVAVYCASRHCENQAIRDGTIALGEFLAHNGIRLVFGGSNLGLMRLLANTVLAQGGDVTGVFMRKFSSNLVRTDLTESFFADTLAERKQMMLERADAAIALPGGLGTLDELFDALALRWNRSVGHKKPIGILNLDGYYDKLIEFLDHAYANRLSKRDAIHTVAIAATPAALFHQLAGSLPPLDEQNDAHLPLDINSPPPDEIRRGGGDGSGDR